MDWDDVGWVIGALLFFALILGVLVCAPTTDSTITLTEPGRTELHGWVVDVSGEGHGRLEVTVKVWKED